MSREFKFRAWDKEEKKMLYNMERAIALDGSIYIEADDWWCKFCDDKGYYNGEDVEIMQYTGIKDSKGIKIYEGDIVRFQFSQWYESPVYWTDDRGWTVHSIKVWEYNLASHISTCEVIGNIYENPELLEIR